MNNEGKKPRKNLSKPGKILINLLVTAVVGFIYFYLGLPAINLQSPDFYSFIFVLCLAYVASALVTSGFRDGKTSGNARVGDYFRFSAHLPGGSLPGPAHCGERHLCRGYQPDLL